AESVAPIVQELLAAEELPVWMRFSRGALIDTGPDVRVAADTRLNAVVISAPPSILNVAEQMVEQLDADPAQDPTQRRQVQMLLVENAEAGEIAESLTAMFDTPDAEEIPPTIRVDESSNSLLIRATTMQFRTIAELVAKIDRATLGSTRQMSLISIDPARASARDIARTLEQLLDRSTGGVEVMTLQELLERRRPRPPVSPGETSSHAPAAPARWVLPFIALRTLTPGDVDPTVTAFIDWITTPAAPPPPVSAPPLARAEAQLPPPPVADGRANLESALAETAGVTIAVDEATNSLVIVGSPRAIERITELARVVETQLPAAPARVRYVALPPEANATVLARLVDQTLRRLTPPGGTPGSLRSRTAVLPDESSNALVVTASDADFETIGDLIAALATPGAPEAVMVKVYPLQTITAERAERSVQNLIGPAPGRGRGRQAQRVRALAITLLSGDEPIEAVLNPERVHVAADPQTNTLVVRAPGEALRFIDEYIALIDQTPVNVQSTMKLYPLQHARANDLRSTLDRVFTARYRSLRNQPGGPKLEPEFAADERTNTLLVTASPEQLAEVDGLLRELDVDQGQELFALRSIEMQAALPTAAAQVIEQVVLGTDQQRRAETTIVPDDNSGVLLVRASPEVSAEIDAILAEIDRDASSAFPVRTLTLERASASAVASAVQRFFDDRAQIASSGRGRRQQARRVSIIGDEASSTLLIAASDEDFAQVETLVAQFDTPQATDAWTFRVLPLRHARASDIESAVENLVSDLTWNQGPFIFNRRGGSSQRSRGSIAVRADTRLNALIVTGEGDKFDLVEELVTMLDAAPAERDQRTVRLYRVEQADPRDIGDLIEELYTDSGASRRWWEPARPDDIKVRVDERSRTLIVSATVREHEEVAALLADIDQGMATADQRMTVLPVEFAAAPDLARTLTQFLRDRARAMGEGRSLTTIAASESANSLIVSATDEELATMRDLLTQLDQPDVSGDRNVQIIALQEGDADEIAQIIREQFGRRSGQGVVVTADIRTNSLIINAPGRQLAQVEALVAQLDTPGASDETIIKTYALDGARADEAVRILSETLQLSPTGETSGITIRLDDESPAVEVRAKIVADARSNSLIVTATAESFPVIATLIQQLDEIPAVSPVEYRIMPLEHAMADDVAFTMGLIGGWREADGPRPRFDYNRRENQLIVSARTDQFEQIEKLVRELDQPSDQTRITDFVPLQFAEAEKIQEALSVFYGPYALEADTPAKRNVRIVADPATNSLVISADEAEWADIRALLDNLDSQEYDASLQLQVIPLTYASARSVARAINDAFQGSIDRNRRGGNQRERPRPPAPSGNGDERREPDAPAVLVEAEEWVRASAEEQTNSVIVSASRQNIRKIEQIIEQLDVADYAKLPPPRLIPVTAGDPVPLADALNQLYVQEGDERGRKGLRIVGDSTSGTLIVRAEEEEFVQIQALAEALQQEASAGGLAVRVLPLRAVPARRVAEAIRTAFEAKAERAQQSLSIQVDPAGNNLVVAASAGLFQEIEATVEQLDALAPAAGHGIFIIELENVAPESVIKVIETIGLDQADVDDGPGRLVSESITVTVLDGRQAIVVVANPIDRDTIIGLVKALDREPELAESEMRVVKLLNADATALANILAGVLAPGDQQSQTPLARAVQEQVRRLAVRRNGLDEPDVRLDLTKPIRVVPDADLNALVISSTPENVAGLLEVVAMFDELPITDAVTVQLFPLENIAAADFVRIVRELFDQGKELGSVPGTTREAVPGGMVGRALLDEIALTIDDRTNTVVVAGKEDSVALVEVMTQRLDGDVAIGWVETRVLSLDFADATDLAETLEAILVRGSGEIEQALPLQRQIGRLRLLHNDAVIESQVFQPMGRLVIRPEPQLNAIILLGAPENLEVVGELIAMLDVEAASPDATVRIYPIEHASAAQLQSTITRLFDQQVESKAIRPEDRLIVQADERTNALIVTTSPRSFAVLDGLLRTLDADVAPDLRAIRRIDVNHASATRLAPLIQELMDARLERLRQVQPETADLERATIVADPRTNALIVAAGNDSFAVIETLTHDLDESTLSDTSLVQVIPVTQGGAERLAETIDAVMERRYSDLPEELRRAQVPLVITDPRTSSLLVAANAEDLAAIEDLVQRLESTPLHPAVGLHVVALPPSVSAELLAPRIERLMRERQQSLGDARQPSDTVSVEPDPVGNTLIVAGSVESLAVVEGLVEVLIAAEAQAVAGRGFEVIPLRASQADDVVQLLEDLYVDEANRTRGPGAVQVSADDRVNAVLVSGTQADVAAVRQLTAELDGAKPATVVEIKYIPLDSANALETVSLIENVLSGRGIDGRRGRRPATVVKYLQELAREQGETGLSEIEVSAAIRESISLTPDLRTNTIIVSAPRQSMAMIERMIRDLDSSSTGAKSIRIFKLENADATAMAEILTELFNLRQGNNLLVLKPSELPDPAPGSEIASGVSEGLAGTELTAVPDERQQLSITVDSRTNSLLVSGTPTYLDLVEEVVIELDALKANEREVLVYQLHNAQADEVARVLGEFVEEEQRKLVDTLSADQIGSAARLLEREVTIQGDTLSNSVLVSASPRYMDRVRQMIEQLDIDPPQVLIQVMLAEVTLDSTGEWGVDFDAMGRIGNAAVSGGFGFATAFVSGVGVPNLAIASEDFSLLIRAMESQGRLQVLSNPSVMAANNQPARIQVGETIRVPESTQFTDAGNSNTNTVEEDVGVILEVTPTINPDGFVRMVVAPEISILSQRTTQINENLESPVITVRTASTTVTVHDGQTIVIGGLISDRFERRDRKVPLLGDIPIVGELFRSESEESVKTELLIVLTPHVVQSPAEFGRVDELTTGEIDRLTLPDRLKQRMLEGRFDLGDGLYDADGNPIPVDVRPADAWDR
ncbi:MAG: hypothetical protein HKO59_00500, partial [Phycisphaerales bacterium]|nr:hypothetical protein [Phycisphaerales bacterium]